jgi:DNA-binding NarL/FixJ family response regulator
MVMFFWSPKVLRLQLKHRGLLFSLTVQAAMRLDEIANLPKTDQPIRLSERERAVLHYLSNGANDATIARELDIRDGTIRTYVIRAMSKLGVVTREHAVAEAMRRRLIK